MKVVGFIFTKISGERESKPINDFSIDTNIDISNIQEEDDMLKISFKFAVKYLSKSKKDEKAKIHIEADIFTEKTKESSEILEAWKKKEVPIGFKISLLNLILKKCTPKAVQLEDELNLPVHIPIPQLQSSPNKKDEAEKSKK